MDVSRGVLGQTDTQLASRTGPIPAVSRHCPAVVAIDGGKPCPSAQEAAFLDLCMVLFGQGAGGRPDSTLPSALRAQDADLPGPDVVHIARLDRSSNLPNLLNIRDTFSSCREAEKTSEPHESQSNLRYLRYKSD